MGCCSRCGSTSSCSCSSSSCYSGIVQSVPLSMITQAKSCGSRNSLILQMYSTIRPNNSWAIPECGETASLSVYGLRSITVGSFLWSPDYGYFEITDYDSDACVIEITNTCIEGNAAPGTVVPVCASFVLTAPCIPSIECTTLTTGISIVDGTATYANVAVADSSIFAVDDIVHVGDDYIATIDAIPDSTHIDITIGPTPSADATVAAGVLVCPLTAEESAEYDILGKVLAFENKLINLMSPDSLSGVSFNSTLTLPTMNVTNPHPTKALKVIIDISFSASANVVNGVADKFKWTVRSEYVADGGTFADEITSSIICPFVPSDASYQLQHGAAGADDQVEIPPLTTYTVDITGYVLKQVTGGAGSLNTLLGTLASKVTALEYV